MSPHYAKVVEYLSMRDIHEELESVYNKMIERGYKNIGEGLYTHSNFIVDNSKLIDSDNQSMIRQYHYSKVSNTPPFASVESTPDDFIDKYIIIDNEVNAISESMEGKK